MKRILNLIFCFLFSISFSKSYSQTVIDYSAWSSAQCNAFYPSASVNSIAHTTTCGTVIYDHVNHAIELDTRAENNIYKGTEYKLGFNFKQGYSYTIKINAWCSTPSFPEPNSYMRVDFNSASNGSGTFCNGVESFNTTSSLTSNNNLQLNPGAYFDYTFQYNSLSAAQSFLYIGGFLPYINGTATSWILIKKVTITETPPAVTFTLSPSSLNITCGSTTPQTFTVTNVNNTPNVTNYMWNLGAIPNGWKLPNGIAAPATYSTGTSNTLALTPVCGAAQKNISVTVTAGGNNYNTNTSTISVTPPSLSISGSSNFCTNATYSINNLPCTSSVIWELVPSYAGTLVVNNNQVTVTPAGRYDNVTLKANITSSCFTNTVQVQKVITFGVPEHLVEVLDGVAPIDEPYYTNSFYSFGARAIEYYPYYPYYVGSPYANAETASYIWRVIKYDNYGGSVIYNLGTYGYEDNPDYSFDQPGEYDIVLDIINNSCAYHSRSFTRHITVQDMFGFYSVSPNPSSGNIKISPNNKASKIKAKKPEVRAVEIINKIGVIKYSQKFDKGLTTVNISVSQLPNDVYTLRIFDGKKWHSHKILVQH